MDKRGQFYIVAAVVIVMAIVGLTSVTSYAITQSKPRSMENLGSDLNEEGYRVVEHGIHENDVDILDRFAGDHFAPYFLQKSGNSSIVFIYGDKTNLKAVSYKEQNAGSVTATLGGGIVWNNVVGLTGEVEINVVGDEVIVNIVDKDFIFDLQENEMFYFVMVQERDGELHVERN